MITQFKPTYYRLILALMVIAERQRVQFPVNFPSANLDFWSWGSEKVIKLPSLLDPNFHFEIQGKLTLIVIHYTVNRLNFLISCPL